MALSPDGNFVAVVRTIFNSNRSSISITPLAGAVNAVTFEAPGVLASHAAFSPDGSRLAVSNLIHTINTWDAGTGKALATLQADDVARGVAFSSDGARICTGTEGRVVMVWSDLPKEARTIAARISQPGGLAFSPDGRRLAVQRWSGSGMIWDLLTDKKVREIARGEPRIAWSTDDRIAGIEAAKIVDAKTEVGINLIRPSAPRYAGYSFSRDGRRVAGGFSIKPSRVAVWDAGGGKPFKTFDLSRERASCVALNPSGSYVVAGTSYQEISDSLPRADLRGSLHVWNVDSGELVIPCQDFSAGVWDAAFSPDGKLLALAMGYFYASKNITGFVRVWNTQSWEVVHTFYGHTGCAWTLSFSPDGKRLASVGGPWEKKTGPAEVKLSNMTTGLEVWSAPGNNGTHYAVAFSPDGRRLATACCDGTIKVWEGTPVLESPAFEALPGG